MQPTIRANLLAPILEPLAARGYDTAAILRRHALPATQPIDPYQLVPLARYVALFEHAADLLQDQFLGLKLGHAFKPELLGPLGFLFRAAPDLGVALRHLSSYVNVWQSGTHLDLIPGDRTAACTYQIDDPHLRPRRQDAEYSLASICALIRNFLGGQWAPLEVHFEHSDPAPGHRAYAQAFHAPVFFSQNLNRLLLKSSDLSRAGVSPDRAMAPFMERHLHDLARDLARESRELQSFSRQVSHLIACRIGTGPLSLPAIAAELGLPARSLQRRLAGEGATFRGLVRDHRRGLAEALIGDHATSVTSIAHTVGYAETAVLSRAFKSWTGTSPTTFARAHRGCD
jgi:AraC-like DNA-binding protein